MNDEPGSKKAAQARADRIRAFREELAELESHGALRLTDEQRAGLAAHHTTLLRRLEREFDIDASEGERQLSWGMRIASALGALALAAAAYFLFQRVWGLLTTPAQLTVLIAAPLVFLAGMELSARRERSLYFTGLLGVVAFSCFVLNLSVLGAIFNIRPSQNAFLLWSAFAFLLAYAHGLSLMLAAGILSLMSYLSATVGTWGGCYWIHFGERPENFLVAGAVMFAVPLVARHRRHDNFPPVYRVLGLLAVFLPILVLANWGVISYLPMTADAVEILYQSLGFLLAGILIWVGIRMGWRDVTNVGTTFFVILLYTKLFDWWWEWMPKYLFFLVLGLIALGLLATLRRVRGKVRGGAR